MLRNCGCSDVIRISSRSLEGCTDPASFYQYQFVLHIVSRVIASLVRSRLNFFVTHYQTGLVGADCLRSSDATIWLFNTAGVLCTHWSDETWRRAFLRNIPIFKTLCGAGMGATSVVLLRSTVDNEAFVGLSNLLTIVLTDAEDTRRMTALAFISRWSREVYGTFSLAHPGGVPPKGSKYCWQNLYEIVYEPLYNNV